MDEQFTDAEIVNLESLKAGLVRAYRKRFQDLYPNHKLPDEEAILNLEAPPLGDEEARE